MKFLQGLAWLQEYVFGILEDRRTPSKVASVVRNLLSLLIIVNFGAVLVGNPASNIWLQRLEVFSLTIFLTEYLLRIWSCTAFGKCSRFKGRIAFMLHPMMLLDLIVFAPILLSGHVDLRMIRVLRLLRIFKLSRDSILVGLLKGITSRFGRDIWMIGILWLFALSFSASLMYYAESVAQPNVFSSLAISFWWAVTTLTTVGYGDMFPITPLGRIIGGFVQVLGVLLLASSAGLFGAYFVEYVEEKHKNQASSDDKRQATKGRTIEDVTTKGVTTKNRTIKDRTIKAGAIKDKRQKTRR